MPTYRQQGYRPQASRQQRSARSATAASSGSRRAPSGGKSAPKRKTQKRRRSGPFKTIVLLALFAFLATASVFAYTIYDEINRVEQMNTFYPGVRVNGIELYNATPQQAYEELLARARQELTGWKIDLKYGEEILATITTETLGMSYALESVVAEAVNQAFAVGRSGSLLERYQIILKLKTEPYEGSISDVQKNTAEIDAIIETIRSSLYIPATDAQRTFDLTRKNNPIVITQETVGREVDVQALKQQIVQSITAMHAGTIEIPTKTIAPTITADMLQGEIVRLANVSTPIAHSSTADRNKNIERGCQIWDGKVIKNGEKVSFNNVVGKRTVENGFWPALEIVSGRLEEGVGGGICQVSTSLYQAAIQANLKILHRENHGITISYADMGADATVSDRGIDFVFQNNTGADIIIRAYVKYNSKGKATECTFEIYGRPDPNGYTYSLSHVQVQTLEPPTEPKIIKDTKAQYVTYTDQEKEVTKAKPGAKVETYLVVKDAYGNVISNDTHLYTDTYKAQAAEVYRGVTPR